MLNLLIIMLECVGIIIAVAFVLTRFQFFKNIIDHNHLERKHEIIAIIFFGLFGVMGTYLGFALNISTSQFNTVFDGIVEDEAIANSRVIGVVIAGLLGGYRVGMSAGLIAGLHRMTLGGFTAFSCGLSTIIASMLASAGDFLRILHKETNKQTALKYEDQYRFFPSPSKKQQYKWMNTLESNTNQVSVTLPITLFGSTIAHLYIIEPTDKINQFDQLAMKRCGEILGQFFWKHHQQKEAQQMKKNEWIFEAITGSLTHEEIVSKIQLDLPNIRLQEAMIAVIPVQRSLLRTDSDHVSETALLMLLRPLFLEYGFHLFTVRDNTRNIYILLLINQQSDDVTNRIEKALQAVHNNNDPLIHNELQWMSFGRMITNYGHLGKSYETALSTLNYQQNIEILNKPFYNNLAVYRLIDRINNKNDLKEIIEDYLAPLIEYDRKKGTELLKTLQVFFKNLGTRSKTAEELNIVRQTLYHRLNRIESLIGKDFMEPQNRMMIEFSMYALKYVDM